MFARLRRTIVVLVVASLVTGCTGYRHVAVAGAPPDGRSSLGPLRVGETVQVELRDGTRRTIAIWALDAEALIGARGERIARAQVVAVRRPASAVSHLRRFAILYGLVILLQVIVFATYDD